MKTNSAMFSASVCSRTETDTSPDTLPIDEQRLLPKSERTLTVNEGTRERKKRNTYHAIQFKQYIRWHSAIKVCSAPVTLDKIFSSRPEFFSSFSFFSFSSLVLFLLDSSQGSFFMGDFPPHSCVMEVNRGLHPGAEIDVQIDVTSSVTEVFYKSSLYFTNQYMYIM